jgi:glycosyltransferase involved in cell wall biosynthesis
MTIKKQDHTFIILAHQESPYLGECVDSLQSQTQKSDILIATSTPSDFLERTAKEHCLELRINPTHRGIAADWNFAFSQARTEYVTLAHQDDIYLPDYTKKCLRAAYGAPDNLIVFPDSEEIVSGKPRSWTGNTVVRRLMLLFFFAAGREIRRIPWKNAFLALGDAVPCPGVMYHVSKLGDFCFSPEWTVDLDWFTWYNLAQRNGSFVLVRDRLLLHRIHPDCESTAGMKDGRRHEEDRRMFALFWPEWAARVLSRAYSASYQPYKE